MNNIQIGKRYTYKGNIYEVVTLGRLKNPTTKEWEDAVGYRKAIDDEREVENIVYTRNLKDFEEKFMPRHVQVGDKVLAYSMGKRINVYTAIKIEDNKVHYLNTDNDLCQLITTNIVGLDGRVGVLSSDPCISHINCLEYYLFTDNMQRVVMNKNIIEKTRSLLMGTIEAFGNIDTTIPQNKSLEDCYKEVENFTNSIKKTIRLWLPSKKQ